MGVRVLAGVTTAALAVSLAQPTDVVKVRLQAGARSGQYRSHFTLIVCCLTIYIQRSDARLHQHRQTGGGDGWPLEGHRGQHHQERHRQCRGDRGV